LKGPNSCRNYGFQKSCGDYINWFDSDDLYKPFALQKVVECINPLNDVIVVKLEKHTNQYSYIVNENSITSNNLLEDYFTGNITFYVCGPFWNRLFLKRQVNLFDEKIRYLDDWDFNLRMLYQEPIIKYLNISLICYNIRENSLSDQVSKLNEIEIASEVFARQKQLRLITLNKKINNKIAKKFVRNRFRIILRDCLVKNHKYKTKLIFSLTKLNVELYDFRNTLMSLTGFFSYLVFNKGYKFFK
jgi:glycosyltransferase involved in cell wall biosynthesis